MRDAKLARLEFRQSPTMERASGSPANFLPQAIIDEFEMFRRFQPNAVALPVGQNGFSELPI